MVKGNAQKRCERDNNCYKTAECLPSLQVPAKNDHASNHHRRKALEHGDTDSVGRNKMNNNRHWQSSLNLCLVVFLEELLEARSKMNFCKGVTFPLPQKKVLTRGHHSDRGNQV